MHLPSYIASLLFRRVMFSFALGTRTEVTAARSSSARFVAHTPSPVTAFPSHRSLSTTRSLGSQLSTHSAGWPNVPLHLQRKVLAWSRSPNAEEALAPPPAVLPSGTVTAAAVSDDVTVQASNGTVAFSLNGNGSSSSVPEAAGYVEVATGSASNCNPVAQPTASASAEAAQHNGNGVPTELPLEQPMAAVEAVDWQAAEPVSSNSNGNSIPSTSVDQEVVSTAGAAAPPPPAVAGVEAAEQQTGAAEQAADMANRSAVEALGESTSAAAAAEGGQSVADAAAPAPAAVSPKLSSTSPASEPAAASAAEVAVAATPAAADSGLAPSEAAPLEAASSSGGSDASASGSSSDAPSSSSSSDGSVSGNGVMGPAVRLVLSSGAAMLPHPDKASRGGEDSFFIADHQAAVGVADGVGGWAEIGVDAGAYARLLMVHAKEAADAAAEDVAAGTLCAQAILESAFYRTNVQGSSTACVLVVNGTVLSASNLGDSGFVLVRDGVATFQCPQQQHNFNFPFQLGSADSMSDQPQAAMRFELQLQPGDIIVTGSDGLWDNIFAEEAATIASKCRDKGETATTAAQVLCRYARMRASDAKYHSPFSYAAIQAGYVYLGGKLDDITVVVSYVTLPQAKL